MDFKKKKSQFFPKVKAKVYDHLLSNKDSVSDTESVATESNLPEFHFTADESGNVNRSSLATIRATKSEEKNMMGKQSIFSVKAGPRSLSLL